MPLVASATADVDGWLLDDMRGQALLRAEAVGLATLAERIRRKRFRANRSTSTTPRCAIRSTVSSCKWRTAADGSELSLWSIGEDRRDDKGSTEWTAQAPRDVVVYFPLRPLDTPSHRSGRPGAEARSSPPRARRSDRKMRSVSGLAPSGLY